MAVQSIVCGTCEAAVPYGRLSCPSCGELLASVARPRRPARSAARAEATPAAPSGVPDVLYQAEPPTATIAADQPPPEPASRDLDAELPWVSAASDGDAAEPEADVEAPSGSADDGDDVDADVDAPEELDDLDDETATLPGSTWALGATSLVGTPTPSYMPRPGLRPTTAPAVAFAGPGAYVPPMPVAVVAADAIAPARAWIGHASDPVSPTPVPEPPTVATPAPGAPTADQRARFLEFAGWLSVAGAAFSAVGFLLPWGLVMIGGSGVDYFDRWGLAGPAHVLVVAGLLTILALTLVANPVPVWIRTGLAGLGLGALLFGLVWPYLIGPLGSGPGVPIVAVGSIGLAASGILALVVDRHVGVDPAV